MNEIGFFEIQSHIDFKSLAEIMEKEKQIIGRLGEDAALEYALQHGYTKIDRNYRTPFGEIDLILLSEEENSVIFAEVKTRTSRMFGFPEDAVTASKMEHMINSAQFYMDSHYSQEQLWRIDIAAVLYNYSKKKVIEIKWMEDVTNDWDS